MNIKPLSVPRSDLAIELAQSLLKQENTCEKSSKSLPEGLSVHTKKHGSVEITCVRITTPAVAQKLQKPRGRYITIQTPPLWNSLLDPQDEINAAADCIREEINFRSNCNTNWNKNNKCYIKKYWNG